MPIFEYQCKSHGVFEKFVTLLRYKKTKVRCDNCGRLCPEVPSLTTMHPDDSWHTGVHVGALDRTFKSRKEMKDTLKREGIARVEPGMKPGKPADTAAVNRRLHVEKHLEGYAV
jgi:uncharacterized Zn finger protein